MPTVPVAPDFSGGGTPTAVQLAQISAMLRFLACTPAYKGTNSVLQTITTGAYTGISCDTDVYDVDVDGIGGHDTATNPSRFTARYPGLYACSGGVPWASNATGRRGGRLAVNGTAVTASGVLINASAAVGLDIPFDMNIVYLNISDYVELQGFQDSGGNLNTVASAETSQRFCVHWIGTA